MAVNKLAATFLVAIPLVLLVLGLAATFATLGYGWSAGGYSLWLLYLFAPTSLWIINNALILLLVTRRVPSITKDVASMRWIRLGTAGLGVALLADILIAVSTWGCSPWGDGESCHKGLSAFIPFAAHGVVMLVYIANIVICIFAFKGVGKVQHTADQSMYGVVDSDFAIAVDEELDVEGDEEVSVNNNNTDDHDVSLLIAFSLGTPTVQSSNTIPSE